MPIIVIGGRQVEIRLGMPIVICINGPGIDYDSGLVCGVEVTVVKGGDGKCQCCCCCCFRLIVTAIHVGDGTNANNTRRIERKDILDIAGGDSPDKAAIRRQLDVWNKTHPVPTVILNQFP